MKTKTALLLASLIITASLFITHAAFAALEGPGSGLIGWWKFDEASGTVASDSSGNGNTGTAHGATWTQGNIGGDAALSFNGTNAYVDCGANTSLAGGSALTVSAWVKPSAPDGYIAARRTNAAQSSMSWEVYLAGGNPAFTAMMSNGPNPDYLLVSPTKITTNGSTWTHVAAMYSSASQTMQIYVNGQLAGSVSAAGTIAAASMETLIGAYLPNGTTPGGFFSGVINDVRIYNRMLTAAEVQALYALGGGTPPPTDTQAPSVPTGLTATVVSSSQINLSWNAATDNVGVAGYTVYRNGSPVGPAMSTAYQDTGLSVNTTYSYTVSAYDAAWNASAQSASVFATTQASSSDSGGCDGAGNCYVRAGATGNGSGLNWANACTGFSGTCAGDRLTRGVTYWVASGNYGGVNFSAPDNGTQMITIKGVTPASHGPAGDWNGGYAGQALFLGESAFSAGYYTIDGQTRGSDWRSGYTLKFWNQNNNVNGATIHLFSGANHLTFRYIEVQGTTDKPIAGDTTGDNGFYAQADTSDLYIGYSYVHDTGNTQFQLNHGGSGLFICEYNYIYKNHTAWNANHDEAFSLTFSDSIIRYNIMQDIMSSGFICDAAGGVPILNSWEIYGNVFFWDPAYGADPRVAIGDGIVGFFGETMSGHVYIYNNTVAGIKTTYGTCQRWDGQNWVTMPGDCNAVPNTCNYECNTNTCSGRLMYGPPAGTATVSIFNNITWNTLAADTGGGGRVTTDYNSYYGGSTKVSDGGAHSLTLPEDPFFNSAAFDFRLAAATNIGLSLPAPYNADINGKIRGADGTWDRGAFEYAPAILYGDVSGDGSVTAYDAALAAAGSTKPEAEVSGVAPVDALDAALIAERVVGLISSFPVG